MVFVFYPKPYHLLTYVRLNYWKEEGKENKREIFIKKLYWNLENCLFEARISQSIDFFSKKSSDKENFYISCKVNVD
jgi:hypothetical protein